MIKDFLPIERKNKIQNFCNALLKNNCMLDQIIDGLGLMSNVCLQILPSAPEGMIYESNRLSILIDDILSMDSINQEEKEQLIEELVENNKPELQDLAKQILLKIEGDFKEAEERGFCSELLKKSRGKEEY